MCAVSVRQLCVMNDRVDLCVHVWSGRRVRVCVCLRVGIRVGVCVKACARECSRCGDEVRMMKPIPQIGHHVLLICWGFVKELLIRASKLN